MPFINYVTCLSAIFSFCLKCYVLLTTKFLFISIANDLQLLNLIKQVRNNSPASRVHVTNSRVNDSHWELWHWTNLRAYFKERKKLTIPSDVSKRVASWAAISAYLKNFLIKKMRLCLFLGGWSPVIGDLLIKYMEFSLGIIKRNGVTFFCGNKMAKKSVITCKFMLLASYALIFCMCLPDAINSLDNNDYDKIFLMFNILIH